MPLAAFLSHTSCLELKSSITCAFKMFGPKLNFVISCTLLCLHFESTCDRALQFQARKAAIGKEMAFQGKRRILYYIIQITSALPLMLLTGIWVIKICEILLVPRGKSLLKIAYVIFVILESHDFFL